MDIQKVINYWLITSNNDYRVAQQLMKSGDYTYCLFFAHLIIEKLLKACVVKRTKTQAPFTHNLIYLTDKAGLKPTKEYVELMERISKYNIEARYPDIKQNLHKKTTKQYTETEFKKIKDLRKWLKKQISE